MTGQSLTGVLPPGKAFLTGMSGELEVCQAGGGWEAAGRLDDDWESWEAGQLGVSGKLDGWAGAGRLGEGILSGGDDYMGRVGVTLVV